jgi:hypothetical protein
MLFDASTVYAPGEPRGAVGYGSYQNVNVLGRYHLGAIRPPNWLVALAGLGLIAVLLHKYGGRR